jgi:hypothetical protein
MKMLKIKLFSKFIFIFSILTLIILMALFIVKPKYIVRALENTTTATILDTTTTTTTEESFNSTTNATSTLTNNSTSTEEVSSQSSAENLSSQTEVPSEEEFVEESVPQPELQQKLTPQLPLLKERKLEKEIHSDPKARHSCVAENFSINLSSVNQATVELKFTGMRSDSENLEIDNLPIGIDVTFLNNGDYSWSSSKSDSSAILQIVNHPGSQKGNFSIPIIYTSGNLTTICQINIINFEEKFCRNGNRVTEDCPPELIGWGGNFGKIK